MLAPLLMIMVLRLKLRTSPPVPPTEAMWLGNPPFFATMACSHTPPRSDGMAEFWGIDCRARQAYNVFVIMVPCAR